VDSPETEGSTQTITVELTRDQLRRLDALRVARNLSRGQLIVELIEQAKEPRRSRNRVSGRQPANPWGQVWPG
jgi:hypothetical protein